MERRSQPGEEDRSFVACVNGRYKQSRSLLHLEVQDSRSDQSRAGFVWRRGSPLSNVAEAASSNLPADGGDNSNTRLLSVYNRRRCALVIVVEMVKVR